ncbi:MAG: hypothetical protein KAS63_05755 [Candidatus Heimdallarchaeota archaeon]|nr:hypothetical protein [Candidatus Heimdallarchaeota archaeon]MCK4954844.1 hypothetical protein [Candidatus Heimdallarchaeota archaeon]
MVEDETINKADKTKTKPNKQKRKRQDKPKREKRVREGKFKESIKEFFKGVWKFISIILRIVLAPFWYTGVLFVKSIRFLRERGDHPLTEKDKKFISLIPALFFMMCLCIVIIFLLLQTTYLEDTIALITDVGFWTAVGDFFVKIGTGIWTYIIYPVFVVFFWEMIIVNFGNFMRDQNYYWATLIIIVIIILITGLGILIYHAMKTRAIIKAIGRFFKKIFQYPKNLHKFIREKIILKYLVGENYIATRTKDFFRSTVLVQLILTFIVFVLSIALGVYNFAIDVWTKQEVLNYSLIVSALLFIFIGLFSTWFFVRVFGVVTKESKKYAL